MNGRHMSSDRCRETHQRGTREDLPVQKGGSVQQIGNPEKMSIQKTVP